MGNRTYSPEFKLQVVLEALHSNGTDVEVARAYDIHPVALSNWKKKLKENGTKAKICSRITEASSLPALHSVFDERFRYYNQERRHSSIGYIPPREHLGKTLHTLESEPQIAAAS